MAILQKKLFYHTKLISSLLAKYQSLFYKFCYFRIRNIKIFLEKYFFVKKYQFYQKGFLTILLLPLISIMMITIFGLGSLSLGIKNISQAQSICIVQNLKRQAELGLLLKKILKLNEKVLKLNKTKKALQISLIMATSLGQVHLISSLKKALSLVKKSQDILYLEQKYILNQSQWIKKHFLKKIKKAFKDIPILSLKEKTFFKQALALKKRKVGDKAYIYKPILNFTEKQKSRISWRINPFYPLDMTWLNIKNNNFFQYECTASLIKKGDLWISYLYH